MTLISSIGPMTPKDQAAYETARIRDLAFDAVHSLWCRRQKSGLTQAALAEAIGRDEAWVSRTLKGPGNWTVRTLGTLVGGLGGEVEITVHALEDPLGSRLNYDAYEDYLELPFESATDNSDFKRTWTKERWEPDAVWEGSDDQGKVVFEIKRP